MMNGYSKIGSTTATSSSHKSRSIDFSEFFSFPTQTPKPIRRNVTHLPLTPIPTSTLDQPTANHIEEEPNSNNHNEAHNSSLPQTQRDEDHENGKGERFGVILGRSCSVSNSSSSASGFQATMKRAFSVRRSSSVTDRYCRIHDQSMAIASDELEDNINIDDATKNKTIKGRRGKIILKACKRLFGL